MDRFPSPRFVSLFASVALTLLLAGIAQSRADSGVSRQVASGGQATFQPQPPGGDGLQQPEIDTSGFEADVDAGDEGFVNRVLPSAQPGHGNSVNAGKKAKSNPELNLAFDGLDFRDQRLANGGKQFSVEPPDQGLCVGNGYVVESTNDVLNVYSTSGQQLLGVTDLNTFYGYIPAITRATGQYGPFVTDPSCLFDAATQRWFHVVLTLDRVGTTSSFAGTNHLDIAVSNTASPLGSWTIYRIPVQDNGTDGTPDHGCPGGFCLGDYPHIGADANGFYITTNEFPLFAPGYMGSQIYAMSKSALASGASSITVYQYSTNGISAGGFPGFTIWPAQSPGTTSYATANGGTEYFLSSLAVFTGQDNRLVQWALTNTQSLNATGSGGPTLSFAPITTTTSYTNPPRSNQPGSGTADPTLDWPLGQCIADATCNAFLNGIPPIPTKIGQVNSNDSRMQQVYYANGKLWASLGTGVSTDGGATTHAGVAYWVLLPQSATTAKQLKQGYLALSDVNLIYPTVAVTPSGRGTISFTMVGSTTYPGVGYAALDALVGAGDVHVAQAGAGLQDGFTEYGNVYGSRPRWGDYGAAAVDGNSIWFATEYIAHSCTLAEYEAGFVPSQFGSCGGTRAVLGNWATRVTKVTP